MDVRLEEIQRLHADCSWAIDGRDAEAYAALFASDGEVRVEPSGPTVTGTEALAKFAAGSPEGVHLSGPVSPRPDGSTRAAFIFTHSSTGQVSSGYYADRYVRDGSGRLVFASREVTMMAPAAKGRATGE
jgi:hypothetical protein